MPKTQIVSPKIRQPSGHFSQATMIEARGRLVFISGMTARRVDGTIAGIGDIEGGTVLDGRIVSGAIPSTRCCSVSGSTTNGRAGSHGRASIGATAAVAVRKTQH